MTVPTAGPSAGGGHCVADALQRRDHRPGPALLDEAHGSLDLGTHAAARELTVGGVGTHLTGGDPADRARLVGAEVEDRVVDVGGDDQHVDVKAAGEQRGRRGPCR